MENWLTFYTLVAFVAGVLLSALVKGLVASLKSKAAGVAG